MLDELFVEMVGIDENIFSRELYMSLEQMQLMVKDGMHIGSHGYDHFWLSSFTQSQQRVEIEHSIDLNFGYESSLFYNAGFILKQNNMIIPNYFESFEKINIELACGYISKIKNKKIVFFKADADQGCPNQI